MKNVLAGFAAAVALLLVMAQVQPSMRIVLRDEGTTQGRAGVLDIVGSYGTAAVSGNVGTITITSPTTTQGDLIYRGASADTRLAKGSAGQFLRQNSGVTAPEWGVERWWTLHNAGQPGTPTGLSPLDSTTYYWGQFTLFNPSTSATTQRMTVDQACTITNVRVYIIVAGTLGSNEDVTFLIRKNDTTDTTLGTIKMNAGAQTATWATSIAFTAGDDFTIGFTTPAWVTNPTTTLYAGQIWWSIP